MDSILQFLAPIAAFLVSKVPVLGTIAANGVGAMIAVGLIAEIVEIVAAITATKKDDVVAAKIKAVKDKVLAVLEIFPHVNLPVAAILIAAIKALGKAKDIIAAIIAAVKNK